MAFASRGAHPAEDLAAACPPRFNALAPKPESALSRACLGSADSHGKIGPNSVTLSPPPVFDHSSSVRSNAV
jgi:hypothetical protein